MKRLILIPGLFIVLCGVAQDIKFSLGAPLGKEPNGTAYEPFFDTNQKKAFFFFGFSKIQVQSLEGYINPKPMMNIGGPFANSDQRPIILGVVSAEKIHIIYSNTDRKQKTQIIYAQQVNNDMRLVGSPVKITSFANVKEEFSFEEDGKDLAIRPTVILAKSADQKHLVLVKERNDKVEMKGFSVDKGEIWKKEFSLDNDNCYLRSVKVSTTGNVYVLGGYSVSRKSDNTNPFLIAFSSVTDVFKVHTIKTGDKIDDVGYNIFLSNDETAVVAGLYSKKQKREAGYQVFEIDPTTMASRLVATNAFTDFYKKYIYQLANDPEFFSVKHILQLHNGNIVFSIEGYAGDQTERSTLVSPAYVVSVSPKGTEQWNTLIQKYQIQPLTTAMEGHTLYQKDNDVYMIYSDNLENFNLSPTGQPKESLLKNTYVAVVKIDETGNATKFKPLNQTAKQVTSFFPSSTYRIGNGTLQCMVKVGGKFYYATLDGKD
jgi:hypothetical protein